jgi:hypothetical protein
MWTHSIRVVHREPCHHITNLLLLLWHHLLVPSSSCRLQQLLLQIRCLTKRQRYRVKPFIMTSIRPHHQQRHHFLHPCHRHSFQYQCRQQFIGIRVWTTFPLLTRVPGYHQEATAAHFRDREQHHGVEHTLSSLVLLQVLEHLMGRLCHCHSCLAGPLIVAPTATHLCSSVD